jgi:uncharacterized protein (TIGR02449 family)
MTAAFDHLEQQVYVLIERCRRLQAENAELRGLYHAQLRREQELTAKLRLACAKVETMLERIRAFEAGQPESPKHDPSQHEGDPSPTSTGQDMGSVGSAPQSQRS